MRLRIIVLTMTMAAFAVACSVVGDGNVQRLSPPDDLTATVAPTTTLAPTTTEQATTTTGLETTTTGVQTQPVRLYYIASGLLNPVSSELPSGYSLFQLIAQLQSAQTLDDPVGVGLRSAIPKDVVIDPTSDGSGVAQVVLPEGFFDTIPPSDQRLAVAQIVLTLLQNTSGIGQVMFNQQVAGPGGELIPANELLTLLDYQSLLSSSTTTFTTTATTTVPVGTTTSSTLPV